MEREPMEMPTKFGLIVFQRENRGRIAAEKLATVLRTAGIMVAFMEDRENYTEIIEEENLLYLDFILLPENTYARLPKHLSKRTKICYYSEKDSLLETLLKKLDQVEANELRKILSVLQTYDLFSYLESANINIMMSSVPENIFNDKLSDFENAIAELDADVFSTMHIGFAALYLKHFHNKICDILSFVHEYSLIEEIYEAIKEKELARYLSLYYLRVKELEMGCMTKVYALGAYMNILELKINPFIKNEFILNFKLYLKYNTQPIESDKLSEKYFHKLPPGAEVRYFFCFSMLTRYRLDKDGIDEELRPRFERYLEIYKNDLENDLENFTPVELTYFFKISGNISQSYFHSAKKANRSGETINAKKAMEEGNPFHSVLIEKAKQYHLKNHDDGLGRGVAVCGFGLYDWTK